MSSEIRVNSLSSRTGLSTVTFTDTGPIFSGITTFQDNSGFNIGTGTSISSPASNTITLGTNSAERLRIDSAGRLKVGTTNDIIWNQTSEDGVVIEQSGATQIVRNGDVPLLVTRNTSTGQIVKFSQAGTERGSILYDGDFGIASAGNLTFDTSSTERLRINSAGSVGIGTDSMTSALQIYAADTGEGTAKGQITLKDTAAYNQTPTGGIVFQGHHTTGAQAIFAGIRGFKANTGNGDYDGCLAFDVRKHGAVAYEAMRINEDGNMGLGIASPTARLDVRRDDADGKIAEFHQSTGYGIQISSSQTVATIGAEYNQSLVFKTGTTATERLRIHSTGVPQFTTTGTQYPSATVPAFVVNSNGDHALVLNNQNTTDPRGLFIYQNQDVNNGTSYFLRARAGGTDRAHLYSNGTLQLHSGNLKLASGNGIDFSATGGPGSMSSELLDDYEEGTFTPTDASGAGLTFANAAGIYTKAGRMVHVQVRVVYPSTSNTGYVSIGGFPFTATNQGTNISNGANASGFGYFTGSNVPQIHMSASGTHTNLYYLSTIQRNNNLSGRELRFGIVYSAA